MAAGRIGISSDSRSSASGARERADRRRGPHAAIIVEAERGQLLEPDDRRGELGEPSLGEVERPWALLAFACDFGKGWVPSFWIAPFVAGGNSGAGTESDSFLLAVLCGGAAVCGHVWPIYLRFRGGKGVATGCGSLLAIDPVIFLGGGVVWLITLALTRFVGLASVLMGVTFPLVAWWRLDAQPYDIEVVCGASALTLLVFLRHRANMRRMLAGTESKVGSRSKGKQA